MEQFLTRRDKLLKKKAQATYALLVCFVINIILYGVTTYLQDVSVPKLILSAIHGVLCINLLCGFIAIVVWLKYDIIQ